MSDDLSRNFKRDMIKKSKTAETVRLTVAKSSRYWVVEMETESRLKYLREKRKFYCKEIKIEIYRKKDNEKIIRIIIKLLKHIFRKEKKNSRIVRDNKRW